MSKPLLVTTYQKLIEARSMFMSTHCPVELIIIGSPGLGKTQAFKRSLGKEGDDFGYISGNCTAFELYRTLWKYRNLPIVLDDVDDALTDSKKKTLLKNVMEAEDRKIARWGSASKQLVDDWGNTIPTAFYTTSNFCIIINQLDAKTNKHLTAILSRAYAIHFVPSAEEVHRYAAEYFDDSEISIIKQPDIRQYSIAQKLKFHCGDWKGMLINNWLETDRDFTIIIKVMNNTALKTLRERAEAYAKYVGTGGVNGYIEREKRISQVRSYLEHHGILKLESH
jgi:hypothetical protein